MSIAWTPDEKDSLVRAAKQIQAANPLIGNRELLAMAMEEVLPEDRRRNADRVNDGHFDWFLEALGIVRKTNKVVWDREERAAVIKEAARIRSTVKVIRDIELLKKAMVVLPPNRRRHLNSMSGTSWDWFREGVVGEMKQALDHGTAVRHDDPIVEMRGQVGEIAGRTRDHAAADQVGGDKPLIALLKDVEARLARIEKYLFGAG